MKATLQQLQARQERKLLNQELLKIMRTKEGKTLNPTRTLLLKKLGLQLKSVGENDNHSSMDYQHLFINDKDFIVLSKDYGNDYRIYLNGYHKGMSIIPKELNQDIMGFIEKAQRQDLSHLQNYRYKRDRDNHFNNLKNGTQKIQDFKKNQDKIKWELKEKKEKATQERIAKDIKKLWAKNPSKLLNSIAKNTYSRTNDNRGKNVYTTKYQDSHKAELLNLLGNIIQTFSKYDNDYWNKIISGVENV